MISCLCVGSLWPYGAYLLSQAYGCTNSKYSHNGSLGKGSQQWGCHYNLVPFLTVLLQVAIDICKSAPFVGICRVA